MTTEQQPPSQPAFDPSAVRLKDIPDKEYRDHVAQSFLSLRDTITQGATQWGFEVVKHFAIINATGIAGATALATSTKPIAAAALGSVYWFLWGLVAAIVTMVVIYFVGLAYTRVYSRQLFPMLASASPISAMNPPRWLWRLICINWLLGAISLALFFSGVIHIVSAA